GTVGLVGTLPSAVSDAERALCTEQLPPPVPDERLRAHGIVDPRISLGSKLSDRRRPRHGFGLSHHLHAARDPHSERDHFMAIPKSARRALRSGAHLPHATADQFLRRAMVVHRLTRPFAPIDKSPCPAVG